MTNAEIKYEFGKHMPISFRDAVLHRFDIEDGMPSYVNIRIAYLHLKAKTTLNFQLTLSRDELSGMYAPWKQLVRLRAKQIMYELRGAAKAEMAKPH